MKWGSGYSQSLWEQKVAFSTVYQGGQKNDLSARTCLGFLNFAILIKSVCWGISSCENMACLHFNRYINIYSLLNFSCPTQTFSKEVDEKSSLKSSVVSTASQLLHVKQADTAALRSSLAKFEQKWGELITQLPAIQEKLHQVSEKLCCHLSVQAK